jgi:cyanate lyase
MIFEKDKEILDLKRKAGVDYRDLANVLGISPNAVTRRVLGFQSMSAKERGMIVTYLKNIAEEAKNINGK